MVTKEPSIGLENLVKWRLETMRMHLLAFLIFIRVPWCLTRKHSETISVTTTLVARGSHISLTCMSIICFYASMYFNIFVFFYQIKSHLKSHLTCLSICILHIWCAGVWRYQIAKCHRPNFQKKRTFPVPTERDLQSKLNQSYFIGVHGLPPPHLKLIWFLILTACKKTHRPSTSHARIFHRESLDWFSRGKNTGKPYVSWENRWNFQFPVVFPQENQPIEPTNGPLLWPTKLRKV